MLSHLKFVAVIAIGALLLMGCKQKGCTDPFAVNYSEDAEKSDGSCVFEGRVQIWFTASTATDLVNASVPNVDIVIDGVMEGSVGMTQSSVDEPVCGSGEGFLAYVDLVDKDLQTLPYVIYKSGTTDIIQSGNVAVTGNQCQWIQLTY